MRCWISGRNRPILHACHVYPSFLRHAPASTAPARIRLLVLASCRREPPHPPPSMRILHVIHGYPPRYNAGSEGYTQMLAGALAARHDVHVVTRHEDPLAPTTSCVAIPTRSTPASSCGWSTSRGAAAATGTRGSTTGLARFWARLGPTSCTGGTSTTSQRPCSRRPPTDA